MKMAIVHPNPITPMTELMRDRDGRLNDIGEDSSLPTHDPRRTRSTSLDPNNSSERKTTSANCDSDRFWDQAPLFGYKLEGESSAEGRHHYRTINHS